VPGRLVAEVVMDRVLVALVALVLVVALLPLAARSALRVARPLAARLDPLRREQRRRARALRQPPARER
jgi:hypothetical protein